MQMNWQPSDTLSYSGAVVHEKVTNTKDKTLMSNTLGLGVGYRMQMELSYAISEQNSVSQNGGATWRWNLGERLYWRTGVNYSQIEGVGGNHFKFFSKISFNYSFH